MAAGSRCSTNSRPTTAGSTPPCSAAWSLGSKKLDKRFGCHQRAAGARIKNFRNVGGWGSEGLNWMLDHGVNLQSDWPANAIIRTYDTPENRERAKLNRIVEYFRLDNWDEVGSCLLAGIPVACGYNWWSHEVTGMDLTPAGDLIIANSWGNWGDQGYGLLQGSKRVPDDAVAIVSMMAA